jgi:selenophosphate synthase
MAGPTDDFVMCNVDIPDEKLEAAIVAQNQIIDIMQETDSLIFGTTLKKDHVTPTQIKVSAAIVAWMFTTGRL